MNLRDEIFRAEQEGDLILSRQLKKKLNREKRNKRNKPSSKKGAVVITSVLIIGIGILIATALYRRKEEKEEKESDEGDIL